MSLNFESGNDSIIENAESLVNEQAFLSSEEGQSFLMMRLAEYMEPADRKKIRENSIAITIDLVREAAKKSGQLKEFNDQLNNILERLPEKKTEEVEA